MAQPFDTKLYYEQLGSFISKFAFAEGVLRSVVGNLLGLDDDGVRVVLSGTRVDGLSAFLKRHYESKGLGIPGELSSALHQLGVISGERNRLVHYSVRFTDTHAIWTNADTAVSEARQLERHFTNDDLVALNLDAFHIGVTLIAFLPGAPDEERPTLFSIGLGEPWRYKSVQPVRDDQKDRPRQ